ncbi:AAA family ATPase [Pelagibacterium lacus]|uniref:MoxR family ATPase n=1 Tax=Pelagibacterium lacus TaxID=2282655 RepID=A0A369W7V7_9HYPH|nr:MoxR family ATPase [Pelagibacterium lacus]RDE09925.1 MoxR family ATPase [Pelagibacterium lacus]
MTFASQAVSPPDDLDGLLRALDASMQEIGRVLIGQDEVVRLVLISMMAGGHALLEGPPGAGKTLLVQTLGGVTGLKTARIQFTPDLMPADITGSTVLAPTEDGGRTLQFQPGPVFTQLLLADEINRATPRTQSALLEAMQERTVSVGGKSMPLPQPFFVLATQNPIEMEGTYNLPEAQIDRFLLRIPVNYPSEETLADILLATTGQRSAMVGQKITPAQIERLQDLVRAVAIAQDVRHAIARLALMTQPQSPKATRETNRYIRFGLSPRGAQALVLAAKANALLEGRYNVDFSDIRAVLAPATHHRIQLNFEGRADRVDLDAFMRDLFERAVKG